LQRLIILVMGSYGDQQDTPSEPSIPYGPRLEIDPNLLVSTRAILEFSKSQHMKLRALCLLSGLTLQFPARLLLAEHGEIPVDNSDLYAAYVNGSEKMATPERNLRMRALSNGNFYAGRRSQSVAICILAGIETRLVDPAGDLRLYPELFPQGARNVRPALRTNFSIGTDEGFPGVDPFDEMNNARADFTIPVGSLAR
jgi:hypothetical protein